MEYYSRNNIHVISLRFQQIWQAKWLGLLRDRQYHDVHTSAVYWNSVLITSHQSPYHESVTNFRAAHILITGMAHESVSAGTMSRLTVWLSTVTATSKNPRKKTPSTPEKKDYGSILWHHAIPNHSPTSLSTSQVYRVTLSLATATTPITDHDQRFYTNSVRFYRRNYTHWIVET